MPTTIADSSLLILADILPTGVFAALQALNHPKVLPAVTGRPWPFSFTSGMADEANIISPTAEDRMLTFAITGLGPVGICTAVSLLDILSTRNLPFRIVAIDPVELRREKMKAIYNAMADEGKGSGLFHVTPIEDAKETVKDWTGGVGCSAILVRYLSYLDAPVDGGMEVVGNTSALSLAYDLVRAFGAIVSVGVHGEPPMPFTGRQLYNKNVSFDFGRCPARAMFSLAFNLLVKRQDVFGKVGDPASLIDKIVDFGQAVEGYRAFDKGEVGKVIFDPWKRESHP